MKYRALSNGGFWEGYISMAECLATKTRRVVIVVRWNL